MCMLCELKKSTNNVIFLGEGIFVTKCPKCNKYMAISVEHKDQFSTSDRLNILKAFYHILNMKGIVDWKMKEFPEHANAHLR